MKYRQKLPQDMERQLDEYIERIKRIQFFKPKLDLKKSDIDTQINFALSTLWLSASIEYRKLQTAADWSDAYDTGRCAHDTIWDAACDATRDTTRDAAHVADFGNAWGAVWNAARGAACDAIRDAFYGAACDTIWDFIWDFSWYPACGAVDILALNIESYKAKYPNGNFINFIPILEAGLYPAWVIGWKFIVYVPHVDWKFPEDLFSN